MPEPVRPSPAPEAPWSEPAPAPRTSAVASIEPTPPSERPPRVTTPPGGVPSQPEAPYDVWRDRIRTTLDRFIYFAALVAIVYLRRFDMLDVGTGGLILLVCGVRPHNVGDVIAARVGGSNVHRAGAVVGAVGAGAITWRSFFATCLVMALLVGGCLHRQPGDVDTTGAMVLKVSNTARAFACDDGPPLGRVPALNIDDPPRDFEGVLGQIRAWVCADAFGALLDLAQELVTHPSPAAESDGGVSSDPSTLPPEDSGGSASDGGVQPSTHPDASSGAPGDGGVTPEVSP